jgi:hypothetical protein
MLSVCRSVRWIRSTFTSFIRLRLFTKGIDREEWPNRGIRRLFVGFLGNGSNVVSNLLPYLQAVYWALNLEIASQFPKRRRALQVADRHCDWHRDFFSRKPNLASRPQPSTGHSNFLLMPTIMRQRSLKTHRATTNRRTVDGRTKK